MEDEDRTQIAHSRRLLLALSHAAQAVQRARTPEAVYRAIGEQATKLGFDVTVFSLSDDRSYLSISYLTLQSKLLRTAEKLTGLTVKGYRLPLTPGNYYQKIIANGEAVFNELDSRPFAEALPHPLRPLAERLAGLFGWQQNIIAPLAIGDEVQGLMVINGNSLTASDVPAITVFANQAAIALENARLYKETQSLAEFNENIIQSMAEGIIVEDAEGIFTFVNPAASHMLGYTRDALIGQHWTTIIPPDQHPHIRAANQRRRRGEAHRYETTLMCKNQHRIPVLVSGSPRFDAQGHFAGTMAVFTNISGRKQAEAEREAALENLQKSELQYRATINTMGDAIHLIDADFRLTLVNSACQQLAQGFAQGPEKLTGLTIFDAFPALSKQARDKLREEYAYVFRTGETLITEEAMTFEGEWFITETRKIPVLRKDEVTQVVTIIRDITKRKQAEQKLRESERRYRELFENSRDGFVIVDDKGRFIDANPAYCQMLGYTLEELRQKTDFYEITPPRWRDWEREEIWGRRLLQEGYSGIYEKEYIRKDGTVFPVELQSFTIFTEQGMPDYLWGIARDITQRKQAEAAIRQSEAKFRSLFENINVAVALHKIITAENGKPSDFVFLEANPAYETLTHLKVADIIGKRGQEVLPDLEQKWIDIYGKVALTGEPVTLVEHSNYLDRYWDVKAYSPQKGQFAVAFTDVTDRKRMEEALRESEEKYRLLAETTRDIILLQDMEGHITYVNQAGLQLAGFELSDVIGQPIGNFVAKEHRGDIDIRRTQRFEGNQKTYRYETEFVNRTGEHIPVDVHSIVVLHEGKMQSILIVARDITERKHAEAQMEATLAALRESEWRNRMVAEMITDYVFIVDVDPEEELRLRWASDNMQRMTGRTVDDAVTPDMWKKIIHPDDLSDFFTFVEQVLTSGQADTIECRTFTAAGVQRWIQISANPDKDEHGVITSIVGAIADITERRQAEEARARLAAQMQQILATVPAGVLLLDAEGRVLQANPSAKKDLALLTGSKTEAILQQDSSYPLTHLGNRPLAELLTSPPTKGLWHDIKVDSLTFEVISQPVETGSDPEHWVLVLNDVTQEREIRAQLQQQERLAAVGQLAAGIAHDFNNIMASIVLYAQMVARSPMLSPRDQERINVIIQQIWHASRLIQQILDFSRRAVLERRPVDLLPLLKEHVKLLARTLPEHIEIELNYDPADYTTNADPTRVQQVLTNLAVNARDAMPHGGKLRIGLAQLTVRPEQTPPLVDMSPGTWIRITVSDMGTGIEPDILPHIFEPFFTTKEPGVGSGLGLAQVHGIVGLHEGYIDVDTEIGRGTTFIIYLPALSVRPVEQSTPDIGTTYQGQGEVMLVVEDEVTLRAALSETLELLNYEVLQAANGQEALAVMETRGKEIHLVLSDVVMPGMGGMALFHALRDRGWQTPVILITGHPLDEELNALQAQGVHAWLPKPPNIDRLAQAIADALHE